MSAPLTDEQRKALLVSASSAAVGAVSAAFAGMGLTLPPLVGQCIGDAVRAFAALAAADAAVVVAARRAERVDERG